MAAPEHVARGGGERRARGSGVRRFVLAVVVLAGLGVAADYGAAAAAEYQVAKQVRAELSLPADPSVRVNGFPFLTQALLGRYQAIDMRAAGLAVGPLHDLAIEATMRDVDAPLSEISSGDMSSVHIGKADARVRIKDKDIGRAIGIEDLQLQPASDEEVDALLPSGSVPEDRSTKANRTAVRIVATTDLAGAPTEIIGIAAIELDGGRVEITTMDVRLSRDDVGEVSLPTDIRRMLLQALSTEIEPGGLPFSVTPTRVWVEQGTLVVEGTAENVAMSQLGIGVG